MAQFNLLSSIMSSVKHWYIPLIVGIIFIACGVYVISTPVESYLALSVLFSVSFITTGLFDLYFSIQNAKILKGWGWYLVSGLLSLIMGLYLVANPEISVAILPFVAGFTILFRAFQLLGFSFDLKDAGILNWGNLAVMSILGIIFSFLLIANPLFTSISIVSLTATAFIFVGLAAIVLAFSLKKIKNYPEKLNHELKEKIRKLQEEINQSTKD